MSDTYYPTTTDTEAPSPVVAPTPAPAAAPAPAPAPSFDAVITAPVDTATETPEQQLGSIIPNKTARGYVYGAFVVAAIAVGGAGAYYLGIHETLPRFVIGAQAVITYLGIPVGGLALANRR